MAVNNYTVKNDVAARTVRIVMRGVFDQRDLDGLVHAMEAATATYAGRPHMVLADMRGMKPLDRDLAEVFGAAIQRTRSAGIHVCAHLSDDSVQRLQASRVARRSWTDNVTVDCVSMDEAEALLDERRATLDD